MTEVKIAAVGDILMIGPILRLAKLKGQDKYDFTPIFDNVIPYFKQADFVIGNLETPIAGRETSYTRKTNQTRFARFNCPDELLPGLRKVGFDFVTTANNHCMDRGEEGLIRTLQQLDKYGLGHTGTFASNPGNNNHWIKEIKGIKIGIMSYTRTTNGIPLPAHKKWAVNIVDTNNPGNMLEHVHRLKQLVDVVIVCLHAGTENHHFPNSTQKRLVQLLFNSGAHIVLGCHPHVIQPLVYRNGKLAIYSLGNFISTRLYNNPHTNCGLILQFTITKSSDGRVTISNVNPIPTWSTRLKTSRGIRYKLLPLRHALQSQQSGQSSADFNLMKKIWGITKRRL